MKYLFLNHKMNVTPVEFQTYKEEVSKLNYKDIELAMFPSFVNIPYTLNQNYKVGSQNVSSFEIGSYTGEVSANQLKDLQISYSLVGHSERRNIFHETDLELKEKLNRLKEVGITPVLCIGELHKEERVETLTLQLSSVLDENIKELIIAYEPVYSIGTGQVLANEEIEQAISFIKTYLKENFQKTFPVLYGGSVDENNIGNLNKIPNVDGFLVGKASLDIEKVKKMMEEMK